MQQNMVIDALESLPGVVVLQVRLIDRLDGCEAVTGRHIRAEALEVVAGGDWRLRCVCWAGLVVFVTHVVQHKMPGNGVGVRKG
jgi:hypothetical protein